MLQNLVVMLVFIVFYFLLIAYIVSTRELKKYDEMFKIDNRHLKEKKNEIN